MTRGKEIGILVGLSLAFGVLIFAALLLLGSANKQRKAIGWVRHSRDVLQKIRDVEAKFSEASSERRAFAISGEESFLLSRSNCLSNARTALQQLGRMVADDSNLTEACDRLDELLTSELNLSNQQKGLNQPELLSEEQTLLKEVQAIAQQMVKGQNSALAVRQSVLSKNVEGMKGFAVLLSLLAFCLFIAIAILFWRASSRTMQAEADLKDSNDQLEQRVVQKTSELQTAMERSSWLASFPERNPNPIIEIGADDGQIYYANPAAKSFFENLGSPGFDHPMLAGLKDLSIPLIAGDAPILRRELSIAKICFFQTITFVSEGRRLRVYSTDISDRKRIQADLDKQNADLQLIFDTVPASIFYKDRNHRLLRTNHELCRLLGVTAESIIGKTDQELGSPYATQYFRDEDEVMLSGQAKRGIIEPIEIGAETRWLLTNKIPYRNLQGETVGIVGFAVDITERRRAEEGLQNAIAREQELRLKAEASENRFRTLVEQSLIGIYVIQGDGFVYVNPAMETIFGYSAQELTTVPVLQFVLPEDQPTVHENIRKRIEGAVKSLQYTLRILRRDQSIAFVEVRGGISELNGKPAILGTLHDITERKSAEERIFRLNQDLEKRVIERTSQLEATNRELEAFSYSVSHDLRAPLRHINGYVEMLKRATEGKLGEKSERYLKTIATASTEMACLIDDLLAFSRVGRVDMREATLSMRELIDETIRGLELELNGREIEWTIEDLPMVLGDRATLKQVVSNLIGNAVKYSRNRTMARIHIGSSGHKNDRKVLFIRDNGAGFDMQYVNKLFGVFQRLHRPEEFEGTGIGLATVRRIIQRHGGETWAEGVLNEGATFYFTLKDAEEIKGI